MNKIFLAIVVFSAALISFAQEGLSERVEILIPALAKVESSCNPKAVGDRKKGTSGKSVHHYAAWGLLQLHSIYVKDVNSFAKTQFSHADAFNPQKAKQITRLYLLHYGKVYERRTGKRATLEVLARIHNGGPRGYEKKATESYWQKVKAAL